MRIQRRPRRDPATGAQRMEGWTAAMRIYYRKQFPAGAEAMAGLERAVRASTLVAALLELVRVRVSQINRCACCLAMHNRDAQAHGEQRTRLDTVAAWREAPFFTLASGPRWPGARR